MVREIEYERSGKASLSILQRVPLPEPDGPDTTTSRDCAGNDILLYLISYSSTATAGSFTAKRLATVSG